MAVYDISGSVISSGGGSSPLAGKTIRFIGDSNLQYIANELETYLEDTYGCTVTSTAYAGATWETTAGASTTSSASAVGQVNQLIATADSSNLLTEADYVIIMMGTNVNTLGTLSDTSSTVTTMCGAMRYCMEKLCYYGRKAKIGVIIPIRSDGSYSAPPAVPTRFEYIKDIAQQFAVPTLDLFLEGRVIPNGLTPDGSTYYLTDSVHMGANGKLLFKQIVGDWIAYGM